MRGWSENKCKKKKRKMYNTRRGRIKGGGAKKRKAERRVIKIT